MSTAPFVQAVLRVALTIVLDTAALVIWNIGTRSPARVFSDVRSSWRDRQAFAGGCVRFAAGAVAVVAAVQCVLPIVGNRTDFTIVACWALVTSLVLEQLIGPDLRALRTRLAKRPE